jgi:WD40 repeat protein
LVLVVDQFEQLFTQCPDERHREGFITALHAAASTRHGPGQAPAALIVVCVRADFESRCADYPELAEAVQDRVLVTSMTERQLRMAIAEPAKKAGSQVDDDLAEALLGEMRARQPGITGAGMLPLLSHALDQAWRSRAGEALTLADYEQAGGIEGAVADSAQRAYDTLTPARQTAARHVFTRLVATSSDGLDTASRATKAELTEGKNAAEAQDVEAVLEAFTAERLLTPTAGTVEITHEVLLTAWPLLREVWLADTHADRIVRTRLRHTVTEWERHNRDPSYLYTGSLLDAATHTATRISADPTRHPSLSQTERDFLHASDRAHRRRMYQRRAILAFLIVMVIGLASTTLLAIRASQQATRQRDIAISSQLISQSQLLADTNPVLSRLLSIAAWHIHPSSAARYAMLDAAANPAIAVLSQYDDYPFSVAFSPNGKVLASGSFSGTIRLWNVATHEQIGRFLMSRESVESVTFSPDSKTLAGASDDGTVRLWNVATRHPIGHPLGTGFIDSLYSVAFSPNGKTLATGGVNGNVRLWDVAAQRQIGAPLTEHTGQVYSVAFSPGGKILASGSQHGVQLWDVASGKPIGNLLTPRPGFRVAFSPNGKILAVAGAQNVRLWDVTTHQQIGAPINHVSSVAFSPDGKTLVTGSDSGTVQLWNVASHQQIGAPLVGHDQAVVSVAFSPDGDTVASGGADGTVRLWDVTTQQQIGAPLTGHTNLVSSVAFSPNSNILASGSWDDTVRLWHVTTQQQMGAPLTSHNGGVFAVAFSPDGKILATGRQDGTAQLWDVATGRLTGRSLTGHTGGVHSVAFSPDGKILATASSDHAVRMWDVATGRPIGRPVIPDDSAVNSVAFSPDGKTFITGSNDGSVRLWDVATRHAIGPPLISSRSAINSVAFSPDGKTFVTGSNDGTVRLWDVATGRPIRLILTPSQLLSVALSPDGSTIATGSADHTVRLWDLATGQQIGAPLIGHTNWVFSVAFSPDGKMLASGGWDGTVRTWNIAYLVNVTQHLCASAGRALTPAEWAQYVQGPAYQKVCP